MSIISDYKSAPFGLFKQFTGYGMTSSAGTQFPDTSYNSLLGTKFSLSDGRTVALVSVAATAITQGVLVQSAAQVTGFQKLAMTVPATYPATAGLNQILVTNGATVLNINQFAGGFAIVAAGTGIGQTLKIASHQPAANAGTFVVTLEDNLLVTLDATSKISLVSNPCANIVITDHTTLGCPIGATISALSASVAPTYNATTGALTTAGTPQYGFIVVHGVTGILVDNTVTNVGYPVGRSAATDGAVGVATLTTTAAIGTSVQTLTSAQVGPIYLNL